MTDKHWPTLSIEEITEKLNTDEEQGLTANDVEYRQNQYGENKIKGQKSAKILDLILDQFADFMVIVLLGATVISAFMGAIDDALAIFSIVLLNAVMGFVQEYRAEKSLEALKKMSAPKARVIRGEMEKEVPARSLVPGDLLVIKTGDLIPADARLITAHNLRTDESILTGESVPATKSSEQMDEIHSEPAKQKNMVFMGATVTSGRGKAVVTGTGMQTEMGAIADMLTNSTVQKTPLQKKLAHLGQLLVTASLFACGLVVLAGIWHGEKMYNMFLAGVSLAVAAIPEGLPAIVTIALALGVQRMIRKNAIIRKLPAVETLGCSTVICSDKTGTLTQNKMQVRKVVIPGGKHFAFSDLNSEKSSEPDMQSASDLEWLLTIGMLCNDAQLIHTKGTPADPESSWSVKGDPTEGALLASGYSRGLDPEKLKSKLPRIEEVPFNPERKWMATFHAAEGENICCVKGAPDIVLKLCDRIRIGGQIHDLNQELSKKARQALEEMSSGALRVIALAYAPDVKKEGEENLSGKLIFAGLAGLFDPPRPECLDAVQQCRRAGIETVMITGDHPNTATAVARRLGIYKDGQQVLTGGDIEEMSFSELKQNTRRTRVYARVAPRHKLKIVQALQDDGHIVAMTGDGVNDAPAVKEADIGVAMGRTGTDVTREASDLILRDDNFATIVSAVREGRAIYDNIRKFIRYLLSCNIGEILTMLITTFGGFPLPLIPIQILWVNLVTDGLPALALGLEQPSSDIMSRDPRDPEEGIFARGLIGKMVSQGIFIGLSTVTVFLYHLYYTGGDLVRAQSLAFTTLVLSQLIFVFCCRSENQTIFEINPLKNPYLLAAVGLSLAMQVVVLYSPLLQVIFKTVPLHPEEWLIAFGASAWSVFLLGFFGLIKKRWSGRIEFIQFNENQA